jgi:hypothetical protein
LTSEGIEDIRIAAEWMCRRGCPALVNIGHSNGGMLAVPHVLGIAWRRPGKRGKLPG